MLFWNDGDWVDEDEATVPVKDYGYLYGDGVFESIAVIEGVVLDLDARVDRLLKSATAMRIEPPMPRERVRDLLLETASRNNFDVEPAGYLRPMLSRASSRIGMTNAKRSGTLRILGLGNPETSYRGEIPVAGAVLSTYIRTTPLTIDARIKAFQYSTGILAQFEAADRGVRWAIFRDADGFVTEAYAANVFCVSDGTISTPGTEAVLAGIARGGVIAAARSAGYEVRETQLTRYDLETADEVFVTGALIGVQAIGAFEGITLPAPGPVTQAVRDAYADAAIAGGTPVPTPATA